MSEPGGVPHDIVLRDPATEPLVTVPDTLEAALARTLREQLVAMERRDAQVMVAKLAGSPFAEGLGPEEILRRADLERWYAGRRIWFRFRNSGQKRWMRGTCVDFRGAPGMRLRVIPDGRDQRLRALELEELEVENRPERTQRRAREDLTSVQRDLAALWRQIKDMKKRETRRRSTAAPAPMTLSLSALANKAEKLDERLRQCWDLCIQAGKELEHERSRSERLFRKREREEKRNGACETSP